MIIPLHISTQSEIPLMSIVEFFVDTTVSFLKRGGNYYLPFGMRIQWFEVDKFRFRCTISSKSIHNHGFLKSILSRTID